jgi:hypothetical protein
VGGGAAAGATEQVASRKGKPKKAKRTHDA